MVESSGGEKAETESSKFKRGGGRGGRGRRGGRGPRGGGGGGRGGRGNRGGGNNHNGGGGGRKSTRDGDEQNNITNDSNNSNSNNNEGETANSSNEQIEKKATKGNRQRGKNFDSNHAGGRGGRGGRARSFRERGGRGRGRGRGRARGGRGSGRSSEREGENDIQDKTEGGTCNHDVEDTGLPDKDDAGTEQEAVRATNDATESDGRATAAPNVAKMADEKAEMLKKDSDATPLSLPPVLTNFPPKSSGVPMILTRNNANTVNIQGEAAKTSEKEKERRKKKPKKKKKSSPLETKPSEVPEETDVSTTEALKALPRQEVSISAASTVKVRKTEADTAPAQDTDMGLHQSKVLPKSLKSKKSRRGLSGHQIADLKAARMFNRAVQSCVERSDPDAMRELLRDKRNHNFALEASVLETVLKAYVVAAMFDDALYCLRNCALPGTLSAAQAEKILLCLPQNLRNSSAFTAADMINALCIATGFDVPTKRTYFMRIVRGIALEFLEEATSARDRICSLSCERLVRSAHCVVDSRLKRGKKATELVVEPGNQLGIFVPDTMDNRGIQAGDAVSILPYAGPYPMSAESLDRNMLEATVTNTQPMVLRLQDKTNAKLYALLTERVDGNVYRIDKLANRMGFNRQLASAVAFVSPVEGKSVIRDSRRPSPALIQAITAMDENIDRVMRASGGFKGSSGELTSTATICSQPVPWHVYDEDSSTYVDEDRLRDVSRLALQKFGTLEGLNSSQKLAVEGATTNRLTLVQGPPGTGKTAVAIRILQHWARLASSENDGSNPRPILATSDSNIAVDNLVEGCANAGLRVVRLGRPEAIRHELLRFCIDRPTQSNNRDNNSNSYGGSQASSIKEKIKQIRNAQVVCCTCIGSGGDILENMIFERVLVDEATQATEPAVLVPLARGCRQLVLVGDHCQLPPTVLSTKAEEEGLGVPLFSRMVACGVPPCMLDTQYRMHPAIAMFPSDLFYGGKLLNGVSAPERRPLAGFPWPREEFPVAFIPIHGVEMDDGVSKMNEEEAKAAFGAVEMLLEGGQCGVSDIAVVTPYAAQARLIRRMTRKLTSNQGPPYIEVSSTDGFQGREKEAVVFSAVRSNSYGAVGFVSDWRRVNVSFTRARRALIVIGNESTLRRGDPETWMPWLAWADAHGLNIEKPGVPRGRYEPEQLRRVRGGTTAAEMLKDVLERQQAQLKSAEKQLQNAERNAAGHIIGKVDEDEAAEPGSQSKQASLEEDLAKLENTDGNWDDSDEEDELNPLPRNTSQPTLSTVSSNDKLGGFDDDDGDDDDGTPRDAWDL